MEMKSVWQGNSHFLRLITYILVSLTLSACDKKESTNKSNDKVEKSIVLSADGIGPINATTSFNMHQLTLAFSDYNVVEEVNYQDGNSFPIIRISEGVKTIMTVIPDTSRQNIYSVMIEDNIVTNNLGHHLGSLYSNIYAYGQTEECQAGTDDMAGKVLCYAPKTPNILYIFKGSGNTDSNMPSADVLQGWGLESVIWRPK
ncbi:MAG: DUF1131 family protein [Cocleimonas sp.]